MRRRDFLKLSGGVCLLGPFSSCGGFARELPSDIKITRVVGFDLVCRRNKVAGRNAVKGVHGSQATDRMIRLYTNAGIDSVGYCRADEKAAAQILGSSLKELHDIERNEMTGSLGEGTMPLWDLAGKVTGRPVYELLGAKGGKKVPVYDGSIYFADLLPESQDNWRDRFREEIDMGMKKGHRAFKVKIGRGFKWMPLDEGYARDKQVLEVIRRHAGPQVQIGVDSNNGYTLQRARHLLMDLPNYDFAFAEEMFPEQVADCLEFKAFIKRHDWKTLLADGESGGDVQFYRPYVEAQAIDICQADMRRFGFERMMALAALCEEANVLMAPHNWGSLIGYYMQLHLGRAIRNFYKAEQDPVATDVIIDDGYSIEDGYATVPDAPGFGLAIDEEKFASGVKVRFDLKT
jgi:L-rhamnonate dehydratase